MFTASQLTIDPEKTARKASDFVSSCVKNARLNGAVVAVSGGVDSAVALAVTVKALGARRVTAITLPERDVTPQADVDDAERLCDVLGITCDRVEITPILDVMRRQITRFDPANRVAYGNMKARTRMLITYYHANAANSLVIGTSNKTELYLGYFTKYGDGGVDVMPLADLYKCQIRQLGRHLGLPAGVTEKPASARLWPGQDTEKEIGVPYDSLDVIAHLHTLGLEPPAITEESGIPVETVNAVVARIKTNEHKRAPPLVLRLGENP